MLRRLPAVAAAAALQFAALAPGPVAASPAGPVVEVGFGESDITPRLGAKPVYIAGYGQDRRATGVRDPLKARAFVLRGGGRKVAFV